MAYIINMILVIFFSAIIMSIVFPIIHMMLRGVLTSDRFDVLRDISWKVSVAIGILCAVAVFWLFFIVGSINDLNKGGKIILDVNIISMYLRILWTKISSFNMTALLSIMLLILVGMLYGSDDKTRKILTGITFFIASLMYSFSVVGELYKTIIYSADPLLFFVAIGVFAILPAFIFLWLGILIMIPISKYIRKKEITRYGASDSWAQQIFSVNLYKKLKIFHVFVMVIILIIGIGLLQTVAPQGISVVSDINIDSKVITSNNIYFDVDLSEIIEQNIDFSNPVGVWTTDYYARHVMDLGTDLTPVMGLKIINWDERNYILRIENVSTLGYDPINNAGLFYLREDDSGRLITSLNIAFNVRNHPKNIGYIFFYPFLGEMWDLGVYVVMLVLIGLLIYIMVRVGDPAQIIMHRGDSSGRYTVFRKQKKRRKKNYKRMW